MKIFFFSICCFLYLSSSAQGIEAMNLKCEARSNPLGIDVTNPKLSWQIKTSGRGFLQSAYQVLMSEDSLSLTKQTAPFWNSGRINSSESIGISYAGKKLSSAKKYYWKVKVWDGKGNASPWSSITSFTTGLFSANDWSGAKWIGYEELPDTSFVVPGVHQPDAKKLGEKMKSRTVVPLFRKEFSTSKNVKQALAFVSGLGHYEMMINGSKISDAFLAPGWTHYDKRVLYNTYDVTNVVNQGKNAIGVIVGNGFHNINRERYYKLTIAYGLPKLICKVQMTYEDGTTQIIVSDGSWKTAPSPITFTSIFGGEDYDATREQLGWDKPDYNDAHWKAALLVKAPKGKLESEKDFPVKVNDVIDVKTITHPTPSNYVYDFNQNASGIVEIKVKGKRGQTIRLLPAELIKDSGTVNQNATGRPYYFSYTLKGDGVETWRPRFSFYGFRYVQLEGGVPDDGTTSTELPKLLSLQFLHTANSSPVAGKFESSNELFNRINKLILWAIKSNVHSVVTDCPHREKLSWLEQDYLMGGSIKANLNVYNLYKKLVYDMMDAQTEKGLIPDIAPEFVYFADNGFGFRDSPEWGSAAVIVPWLIYQWYGDKEILRTAYPMMKKYVAYLKMKSKDHILTHGLGDWFDLGPNRPGVAQLTPKGITATAIYYYDLKVLSQIAALLNNAKEAAYYRSWSEEVKSVFNETFFDKEKKVYATGSQTSMAMPLSVGLVEEQHKKAVLQNLVDSIRSSGKQLTAGDIGFHFLVDALHKGGASQLLYEMNYRDDVPGYGFQLKKGATALTESWPALEVVSNNHLMLGHIMEWFYDGLVGINQSQNSIAYKNIVIKPEVVGDINWVKGSYESLYGIIRSEWKKENDSFELEIEVPANATATIYLPATEGQRISEGGKSLQQNGTIKWIDNKDGRAVLKIGSGIYHFVVK